MITSCVWAARYFRACSSRRCRVASSCAGSSSSFSSPDSASSSTPSAIETSPPSSASSPFNCRICGRTGCWDVDAGASTFGRLLISPPAMGSSSLFFPGAFSGSTGVTPRFCWGTVSLIRLGSDDEGEGEAVRFGEDMTNGSERKIWSLDLEPWARVSRETNHKCRPGDQEYDKIGSRRYDNTPTYLGK